MSFHILEECKSKEEKTLLKLKLKFIYFTEIKNISKPTNNNNNNTIASLDLKFRGKYKYKKQKQNMIRNYH